MHLHWVDWTIVGILLLSIVALTLYVRNSVRSLADFLAANRMAGRNLLAVSGGTGLRGHFRPAFRTTKNYFKIHYSLPSNWRTTTIMIEYS